MSEITLADQPEFSKFFHCHKLAERRGLNERLPSGSSFYKRRPFQPPTNYQERKKKIQIQIGSSYQFCNNQLVSDGVDFQVLRK